jgi:hypothetical protein
MFNSLKSPLLAATISLSALAAFAPTASADPIDGQNGWSSAPVNFKVQWPYNVSESSRYTYSGGVYHLWVYNTDAPFEQGSTTKPRTEQRFNPDYTAHEIQYAADIMVPSGSNAMSVFQIHTGDAQSSQFGSTTFMLFWYSKDGGSVHDYSGTELASNLTGQYFHLNVDHNLNNHTIQVWINSHKVWTQQDNGATDFYMKDGVYMQTGGSSKMEAYIKNIKFWTHS